MIFSQRFQDTPVWYFIILINIFCYISNGFNYVDDSIDNTHSTGKIISKKGTTLGIFNEGKQNI